MNFIIVLTFDLNANSQDSSIYSGLNDGLAEIGLKKEYQSTSGSNVELPDNTYLGIFSGKNSKEVCNRIRKKIKKVFSDNGAQGKFFVSVGNDFYASTVHIP